MPMDAPTLGASVGNARRRGEGCAIGSTANLPGSLPQRYRERQLNASSASHRGARGDGAVQRELGPFIGLPQRTYQRANKSHAQGAVPDVLAPREAVSACVAAGCIERTDDGNG